MAKIDIKNTDSRSVSASVGLPSHDLSNCESYSVQVNTTSASSLDIDFTVEVSNDDTNWTTLEGSLQNFIADATHLLEVSVVTYKFMRAYYTRTGGSATFETIVAIKK